MLIDKNLPVPNEDDANGIPRAMPDAMELLHRMRVEFPNEIIKIELSYVVHPVFTAEIAPRNPNHDGPAAVCP